MYSTDSKHLQAHKFSGIHTPVLKFTFLRTQVIQEEHGFSEGGSLGLPGRPPLTTTRPLDIRPEVQSAAPSVCLIAVAQGLQTITQPLKVAI